MAALARELEAFRRILPELLGDPRALGKFALVHGDAVAGVYSSFVEAMNAGYDKYELDPFLVKQVTDREEPKYFSRGVVPCK